MSAERTKAREDEDPLHKRGRVTVVPRDELVSLIVAQQAIIVELANALRTQSLDEKHMRELYEISANNSHAVISSAEQGQSALQEEEYVSPMYPDRSCILGVENKNPHDLSDGAPEWIKAAIESANDRSQK